MVISGKKIRSTKSKTVKFDGERICLPPRFAAQAHLDGNDQIECYLLVVTAGRYRLLKKERTVPKGTLSKILSQIEEIQEPGDLLRGTRNNAQAALPARLIPCMASPPGPGWRIVIPKEAKELAKETEEPTSVSLLIVAGFVEIWFPETLRRAVSEPLSTVLM
jgi:hypothetical protein